MIPGFKQATTYVERFYLTLDMIQSQTQDYPTIAEA